MTSRYYCGSTPMTPGARVELSDEESRHLLKVMRAQTGDSIVVFGDEGQFSATVVGPGTARSAVVIIGDPVPGARPPAVQMTFLIPWIKGGKTDLVVQKLTEIGACGMIVFQSEREVARGDDSKLDRLRRVALEACKQCERVDMPKIESAGSLRLGVDMAPDIPRKNRFLLHERNTVTLLSTVAAPALGHSSRILFASGPEGGWHDRELESVEELMLAVSLGPRILRAETAPIVAASAMLTLAGEI